MSSIADLILNRGSSAHAYFSSDDPYEWLERIKQVSPSIYKHQGILWHEHVILRKGDVPQCMSLIRSPSITPTKAQAVWLYDMLYDWAPELSERYILVSADFVWDSKECELISINDLRDVATVLSDEETKRIRNAQ